jgi:hypothetical protein
MTSKAASTYRADSTDATLARIMANLEHQDKASATHRAEIRAELSVFHNDLNQKLESMKMSQDEYQGEMKRRVTDLEKESWTRSGRAAAAVFIIGFLSWFLPWIFIKK